MSKRYPPKFAQADAQRREITLIHVARQQLKIDDDTYRAMLRDRFGVASSKDMDWKQRKALLEHFKDLGFKVRASGKAKAQPSRALATYPEATKIRALWLMLYELGAVRNKSEEALAAYIKRLTKVDALQWITGEQAETVIETLKKWAMRFLPAKVEALGKQIADAIQSGDLMLSVEEIEVLISKVSMAQSRGTFDPMQTAYEALTQALAGLADHDAR